MAATLKENSALIETLKAEVGRLRPFEEKISNFEVFSRYYFFYYYIELKEFFCVSSL